MFSKFLARPLFGGGSLGVACALLVWSLSHTGPLLALEDWALDTCFVHRGTRTTSSRLVVVAIDDRSLGELRKPYAFFSPELAEVVRYLNGQGAAAIGIDVMVPDDMKDLPEIADRGGRGAAAPMGEAVREAGGVVLPQRRLEGTWLRPVPQWLAKNLDPATGERTDLGFVDLNEDRDHFVRRQQLLVREDDDAAVQFALALYARGRGEEVGWDEDGTPVVGGQRIPLEPGGLLRVNYVGPPGTFKDVVSFRDVLADARAGRPVQGVRGGLRGAVVMVGMTARGGQDYHATPFANAAAHWSPDDTPGLMSGTEVQANVYATLHDRAYIRSPGRLGTVATLVSVGGILGWLFTRYNLLVGAVAAVVHHFAWKGLALAAFGVMGWRVPVVAILLLGLLLYAASLAWRWRVLLGLFRVIKGGMILDELWKKGPPQKQKLTVMFADIRGFTTFSEEHEPAQVAKLLNAYFTTILPAIQAEGGTVNQFMGDGIMVLFGAPTGCEDHARRAVRAAAAMVRRVHECAAMWRELDAEGEQEPTWKEGMRIGVGINTGEAVVGTIGSPDRRDYTAIGDTTNTAARIEALNKELGTEILVSEATLDGVPPEQITALGFTSVRSQRTVKGRKAPVVVFALSEADGAGRPRPDRHG